MATLDFSSSVSCQSNFADINIEKLIDFFSSILCQSNFADSKLDVWTLINFILTGLPEKALIKIATLNDKTPNEYAKGIVISFLNDQVRGYYQAKFNALTTLEMIQLFGDLS